MDLNLNRRAKEELFHYQDSQAVEKDAHRICEFSVLGGFQSQVG